MKNQWRWLIGLGAIVVLVLAIPKWRLLIVAALPCLASWLLREGTTIGGESMSRIRWT